MRLLLLPLSWLYGAIVVLRNFCYDAGLFRAVQVGVPVISVGNISAGGTGKTPLVELLIGYLSKRGKRVGVLTRGYGRSRKDDLVLRGSSAGSLSFRDTGDEPMQIARKFPEIPVLIGSNRVRMAIKGITEEKLDVLVMDDGFQHRSLHRDLDLVLVDDSVPAWMRRMLPAGRLREPLRGLGRADVVIHSRSRLSAATDGIQTATGAYVRMETQVTRVVRFDEGISEERVNLNGMKITTFCGIGNPEAFRTTVAGLGGKIVASIDFPDHQPFSEDDIDRIVQLFHTNGSDWLVTTEKDAIRLQSCQHRSRILNCPVGIVIVEASFAEGGTRVFGMVDKVVRIG